MHIAVLAASGATGRQLALQALERGHTVTAVVRDPGRLELPDSPQLRPVRGDVQDPASIARALAGVDVVLSGLGVPKGGHPGILAAGARAVVQAGPPRIIWLGAFGTGASAAAAGALTRRLIAVAIGAEVPGKVAADTLVREAGGSVFHAGLLTNGALSSTRRRLVLADVPRRLLPRTVSRATVAATMLDEAESPLGAGQTLVPLSA